MVCFSVFVLYILWSVGCFDVIADGFAWCLGLGYCSFYLIGVIVLCVIEFIIRVEIVVYFYLFVHTVCFCILCWLLVCSLWWLGVVWRYCVCMLLLSMFYVLCESYCIVVIV